ncbi:hypothetical protein BGZ60DRAFT_526722 [Tricladium varicosporioides]|nr:hypothetical protein BGZ60DRAFT_526722 [Hymenoscyphus varicosporioides]
MKEIQQIPGYYYDPEKGKYFKIQPSSSATSSYSIQDVKRRKTRDENIVAEVAAIASQKGRIRKSVLLGRPLSGAFLAREMYQRQNRGGLPTAEILASGYVPNIKLELECPPLFAISPRRNADSSTINVYTTHNSDLRHVQLDTPTGSEEREIGYRFSSGRPSTSISINNDARQMALTWLSGTPSSSIAIISMLDYAQGIANEQPPHIMILGPGYQRGSGQVDVFASTSTHPSSPLLFAFGTSHGILAMKRSDSELSWLTPKQTSQQASDILAMEFCPDNPFVLLSGDRKGNLEIWDHRVPSSELAADTVFHPSSIIHIKQLDSYRTVVAGLKSSLVQYDLRYRKTRFSAKNSSFSTTKASRGSTQPVLQYPEYQNSARIHIGFDVDIESGIIAAAQEYDEFHPAIQLFSLSGGHVLKSSSLQSWMSSILPHDQPVRCLKFANDMANQPKSLWASAQWRDGAGLEQFRWATCQDCDEDSRYEPSWCAHILPLS